MSNLSAQKLEELNSSEVGKLKKANKDDLVSYIMSLRNQVEIMESIQLIAKQVNQLQRSHVRSLQYSRRESIELHGIPTSIDDNTLEATCVGILHEIGCSDISPEGIHACHRLKNKENVIIRFVNRKDADVALHNRGKLKVLKKESFNLKKNIYINESLCRPMQFLNYKVRCAFREKKIASYNFWKGKLSLKLKKDNKEITISHIDDLININLAVAEDRLDFIN